MKQTQLLVSVVSTLRQKGRGRKERRAERRRGRKKSNNFTKITGAVLNSYTIYFIPLEEESKAFREEVYPGESIWKCRTGKLRAAGEGV